MNFGEIRNRMDAWATNCPESLRDKNGMHFFAEVACRIVAEIMDAYEAAEGHEGRWEDVEQLLRDDAELERLLKRAKGRGQWLRKGDRVRAILPELKRIGEELNK